MNPTLYDILGVPSDAGRDEIRQAWREAADRFDPGSGGSKQFRLFNEAAEVLLDPERRAAYDEQLARGAADAGPPEHAAAPLAGPLAGPVAGPVAGSAEGPVAGSAEGPGGSEAQSADDAGLLPGAPMPGASVAAAPPTVRVGWKRGATSAAPDRGRTGVAWPVVALLGMLAALAVGAAAYLTVEAQGARSYLDALDRAPDAAESAAAAVLSYDHASLEADRDAAAKFLTPAYRDDYIETFDKLVSDSATETKATVEAEVLASSAMAAAGERRADHVPVLLFVNQTTTSSANAEPSVALNRVRMDMVNVDGVWLVDQITSY
jgi:Mce-associated membrane protein